LRAYEDVMKAVADPTRVRIIKILEGGELCVCQIIAVVALGQSTISKHLFLLRAAGLIKDRRDKKWVHYSLDGKSGNPFAGEMLRNIRKWLNDAPVVVQDRDRTAMARNFGPVAICERGNALPVRKGARSRPGDGTGKGKSMTGGAA
jgi:ArsR family transcriptional regulator